MTARAAGLLLSNSGGNTNTVQTASGQASNLTINLPTVVGSSGQAVITDGAGNWSYTTISTASTLTVETTSVAYNTSSPITQFTLPVNAVIEQVVVYVDTAFTGGTSPNLTVGVSGTTAKYMGSGDSDLTTIGSYVIRPGLTADGSTEALIITYSAGSSTAGAARVEVQYSVPTH
ncbi:hypothetical protein FRUB_00314 [Fimbriiglobus ruber]|uniref:Uncharacterized protein n=1 Tax=Fimbriiglobus ruber TaxID=1908690 RepID=A0A225EDZ1_9BACT|nr:hypothetical protein FRUB_00314 [Fimbriiglobus ruber]